LWLVEPEGEMLIGGEGKSELQMSATSYVVIIVIIIIVIVDG